MRKTAGRIISVILTVVMLLGSGLFDVRTYADDSSAKAISKVSYEPAELPADGGKVSVTLQGSNLFDSNGWLTPKVYCGDRYIESAVNLNGITDDFDGSFTLTLPSNSGTSDKIYSVKYMSARYDYQNPEELIPSEGADILLTVKGREAPLVPEITSLEYDKTVLKADGGQINITVKGSALTQLSRDDLILKKGDAVIDDSEIAVTVNATDDSSAAINFALPANDTAEDQFYTFIVRRGADSLENKEQQICVKAASDDPLVESIEYSNLFTKFYHGGNPDGGYYYLPILLTGENLDKLSKSDFRFEVDGNKIDLDDTPEDPYDKQFYIAAADYESAEIHVVFPKNTVEAERACSITVLCAEEGVKNRVKTVPQDAKPQDKDKIFRLTPDDWYAALLGEGVIMIRIDNPSEGIELNVTPDEIRNYVYLATSDTTNEDDIRWLTSEDSVTIKDNVITIDLADKDSRIPAAVIFRSGALRNAEGKYLGHRTIEGGNHFIYYHSGAHIEKMAYNKVTFGSGGGHLVATATGTNLDENVPVGIYAKIFRNNESDAVQIIDNADVAVNVDGTEAVFEFDVPANDSDMPVSYRLIPVVNGFNAVPTYIKGYDVISVLPSGAKDDAVTLSCIDIQGESDEDLDPERYVTEMKPEQFTAKCDLVIRGTRLSSKTALVKAVDEEGIVWPLLPVHECGATFRWQNSAMYLPESESINEQHIELLIPRRLGVTHTFTFYIAPDGKNFDEKVTATAVIRNNGVFDYEDMQNRHFVQKDFTDITEVTVKYVDESGKELAKADTYRGYGITELYHQGIAPKQLDGYRLKSYTPATLDMMLEQPVRIENGKYKFEDGQWFFKDLRNQDGSMTPIVYTYEKSEDAAKTEDTQAAAANKAAQEREKALAAKYTPGKVKLTKAKRGKKRVTLTWKTIKTGVNGYQVSITDKKSGKIIVTKNIKQNKKLTKKKTIKKVIKSKKLKKGSYTISVRAYRNAEGRVFYGAWSNKKSVKIKK